MRARLTGLFLVSAGLAVAGPDGACAISQANILSPLTKITSGVPFTIPITTTGCTAPLRSVRIATGTLPFGAELYSSPTGAEISGTVYTAGSYVLTIRAVDAAYKLPTESVILQVNEALRIDTPAVASGLPGSAYSDTIRARGGVAPYTFSTVEGALPSGLTLNASSGAITGNMPATGSRFRLRVTDSASPANTSELPYTITTTGQVTTLTTPPVGSVGTPYSFDIDGSLGAAGFSVVIGSLPSGLTINTNGLISGTPSASGEFHITVRQTAGLTSAWRSYRLLINNAATISGTPRDAEEGAPYNHVFAASGSVGPYTYAVTAGTLPTGISLSSSTGALTGALPLSGSGSAFTITATDASGRSHNQAFSIAAVTRLSGSTAVPPVVRMTQNGSATPYILGGGGSGKEFNLIGGIGAQQVFINPFTGNTAYSFSTPGTYTPIVLGTDSLGGAVLFNTVQYRAVGLLAIDPAVELPNGKVGVSYAASVPVLNGDFGPLTYTVTAGTLPMNFTLGAATGLVSGTGDPMDAGQTYSFTVTVTDSAGQSAARAYFIGIASGAGVITTLSLPAATLTQAYSTSVSQTGSLNPVFTNPGGGMPPGLTLSSAGLISGTPNTAGTYTFLVRMQDAVTSATDTRQFTVYAAAAPSFTMSTPSPNEGTVDTSMFIGVTPAGGRAPYTLSLLSGSLPEGLFFQNFGSSIGISGFPLITANQTFTILLTDADGRTASAAYTINLRQAVRITTLSSSLPVMTTGVPYSTTIGATLGSAPYTFTIGSGALPAGISLSTAGILSGTPTATAATSFSILATDSFGRTGESSFYITPGTPISISNSVPMPNGVVLSSYSVGLNTGLEANSTRIVSGDLPPLLYVSSSSGLIVGEPTLPGVYTFTVQVDDGAGRLATQAQQITVLGGLSFTPATVPNGVLSSPYSVTFVPVNASGSVTWSIVAGSLPPGLTLNPSSGILSGTPNATGPFSFTVQAVDAALVPVTQNYTMQVLNFLTISPSTVPNGTVGTSYSQVLTASGGSGGTSWAITAGALPGGLTLGPSNGILSGTPSAPGTFNFTVTATDSFSQTGSRAYTVTIASVLSITPSSLPNGTVSTAYNQQLTATGGTGAIGWAVTAGALPGGLTLGPTTGAITGTPSAAGSFSFTVTATDSLNQTGVRAYTMTVLNTLSITPASLANGTISTAYNQQLTATGGSGAIGWSITAGALPAGLTLGPTSGAISGTPTAAGTFNFTVTATDSLTQTGTRAYSLTVLNVLGITPSSLPGGTINTAYTQQLTATGATGATAWTVSAGALPGGLALNPTTGAITGTPTAAGAFSFTVTATDSLTQTGSQAYSLTVANVLTIGPATLPNGTISTAYSQQLTAMGGTGAVGWAVTAGALPGGLTLGPTSGAITGTPTAPGAFTFTVTATDSLSQTGSRVYSLTVNGVLTITPSSLPGGTINTAYTQQLTASGATGATGWTVSAGALPGGLALNPTTGALTGTPTAAGAFSFTVTATDSLTQTGAQAYSLTVANALTIGPASLPNGTISTAYTQQLTATGGSGLPLWSVTAGALPGGLTLGPTTGAITGTPTTAGAFTFTVTATDSLSQTGSRAYSLTVNGVLIITPSSLPGGTINTAYSQQLTATGATGATGWAVSAGALPGGLTLNPTTGALTGTPTAAGTFPFTVTATDSLTQTGAQAYSLTVANVLTIGPATLPNGTISTAYTQQLTATGGSGLPLWSVSAGALPGGLTLNPTTGALTGTPTASGLFNFTVTASDSLSQTGSRAYALTINGVLTITPATLPNGTINTAYSQQLTATGATGWAITAGALPGGLTLNPTTGAITGTPTAAGSFPITVTATDSQTQTGVRDYSLVILNTLTIAPATLPNGTAGSVYNQQLTATPTTTGISWAVSAGTLPTGLTLNPQTGQLTGTPTAPGQYTFTATATDPLSQTGSRAYTVTILAVLSISPVSVPVVYTGVPYTQAFAATGGTGAITWSIGSAPLPPGLTLNPATGIVSGTTSATTGLYTVTIQATDSLTQTGSRTFDFLVRPPVTITPAALPDATQGTAYSQALTANGALGTATFQLSAGALPAGLALATNGVISGTPTAIGTATFDVTVTTTQQQSATRTLTLTVLDPLAIATATLPDGTEFEAYSTSLAATGGATSGLTWVLQSGSTMPPGLTLSNTGAITGTPTRHGTYTFTVQVANAIGTRVAKPLTLVIVEALSITSLSLGETVQGRSYSTTLTAIGGRAPYTWALVNSALPTGLQLNPATGLITGTTNVTEGTYPQNVAVTDSRGRVARRTLPFAVTVPPPPSLNISPTAIANGRVNQPYSAGFSASGGTPGYSFAIVQGAPPPGLSLNGTTLSGTPTQEGTFRFTVNATDSQGRVAGNQYTVVIEAALVPLVVTPSSIAPTTQVGQPLTLQFGATGGKAPYTFAISGNTPPGTSSNSSGVLSGTPSQGGTFAFTVQVTDSLGDKASRGYSISVTGNLSITTQPPLAEGTVGKPYSLSFGASGGKQPYTWSIAGTPPPGLAFNNGDLSGTPTAAGTFSFSVNVQDTQQLTASASFSITVWNPVTITSTLADTPLITGQPFNFTVTTQGGKPAVTITLIGGALPPGLTFANGVITGTPTGAGNFSFTLQAIDGLGNVTTQTSTLRVVAPLTVSTTTLPSGTVGTAYNAGIAATGGVAPLGSWSLSQGTLPAGLALSPDGAITGTPTAPGTSTFTVRITDAANTATTRQLTISIQLPPVPGLILPGLPQFLPPGTQTNITIQLAQPFPVPVTGTLTLIFEPNAVNNADDPSVQFSSGGRTVTFVIPAGQTAGTFPVTPLRLISGTVAGTIRIRITTSPEAATPVPDAIVPITRSAPVITAGTAQLGATSFTLLIDGFSNTREIVSATFRLTPAAGSSLATTDVPVNVAATFAAYYQSAASVPFGGQFRLTQPFNVNGPLTDIDSVVVTVTNSVGTSQPFTIRLR